MVTRWSSARPKYAGLYRMRDRIFGWGPIEVRVYAEDDGLVVDYDGDFLNMDDISSWVEWREINDAT